MNKISTKAIVIALCLILGLDGICVCYALQRDKTEEQETSDPVTPSSDMPKDISKDETVYILANAEGSVQKIIVSDCLKNSLSGNSINDKSELTDIKTVKGDESYSVNNGSTVWDSEGNDIYYQGSIDKELPVDLSVSYTLDGQPISADKIAGKSGKVTIRFDYDNKQSEKVMVDGTEENVYVPFTMVTGMILNGDTFKNVEVTNGKLINDGNNIVVIGLALPGLQENLGIDTDKIEIPDYVEITSDVTDFEMGMTVTMATNELFNNIDTDNLDSIDDLKDSLKELSDGMDKLMNGSDALYDGLSTLSEKSDELATGVKTLSDGATSLKDGVVTLDDGVGTLDESVGKLNDGVVTLDSGMGDLSSGLSTLSSNNDSLNGGAKQVFDTLLATATKQLNDAGVSVPTLTIDNYSTVLDNVISTLDKDAVYQTAIAKVRQNVMDNYYSAIEDGVTAAVRSGVEAKVKANAIAGFLIQNLSLPADEVNAALTNGTLDSYNEVYGAYINAFLESEQGKALIKNSTDAQMETDAVKATINTQIENQIETYVTAGMQSEEVQNELAKASAGLQTIAGLKTSLDSYNKFYMGLASYTDGVKSAADGASKLKDGTSQLKDGTSQLKDGTAKLKDGTSQLRTGSKQLADGTLQLKNNIPALVEGVNRLKDGSKELSDGLKKFNDEGISKIVELADEDLEGVVSRLKATADVSKNYRNFSGLSEDMDGKVKFIYRTDEISAD